MLKNKKGVSGQILTLMIVGFILIGILIIGFLFSVIGPILTPTLQDANSVAQQAFQQSGDQNIINAGQSSFQPAADSLNNLEWLSYTMLIVMFLVFFIMCFFVRAHPYLLPIWIVLVVVLLFCAIWLSVAYQELRTDPLFQSYYTAWGNTDFALQNLPLLVLIGGIIGGIIMFGISKNNSEATGEAGPI